MTSRSLAGVQHEFAAHLRHPGRNPAPAGIEDRRLQIYRRLFYNNVENLISNNFPVLRSITSNETWHRWIRSFMADHDSVTPYFLEIGEEFLNFLEHHSQQPDAPPFRYELAHYEWIKLKLEIAPETIPLTGYNPQGDLLQERPVLSPLAWLLCYRYPVARISPTFQPQQPEVAGVYMIGYRTRQDQVNFLDINALTARLMELLAQPESGTGEQMLRTIATELKDWPWASILAGGQQALAELHELEIVLGTSQLQT